MRDFKNLISNYYVDTAIITGLIVVLLSFLGLICYVVANLFGIFMGGVVAGLLMAGLIFLYMVDIYDKTSPF